MKTLKKHTSKKTSDQSHDIDSIYALFSERQQELQKLIDSGETHDQATSRIAQTLMQAVIAAVPNFEKRLKNGTSRDVYAFVALTDMILKVSIELRNMQDRNVMSNKIMKEVIQPNLKDLTSKMVAAINDAKSKVPRDTKNASRITDSIDSIKEITLKSVTEMYVETGEAIAAYFGGSFRDSM